MMMNVMVVLASTGSGSDLVEEAQIRVTGDCFHAHAHRWKYHSEARRYVELEQPHLNRCFLGCSLLDVLAAMTTRPDVLPSHLQEAQNLILQAEMAKLQLHLRQ
jgi:hypothetical protein